MQDAQDKELLFKHDQAIVTLMTQYRCAMLEVKTKLDVLNMELSLKSRSNPFESIICRLKSPQSIIAKLEGRGLEITAENIYSQIHDVAGIRVICSHPDDIYALAERLCNQDDIRLMKRKDYIDEPKPNGYRSLHLIVEIPIFLMNETKLMDVEVQFRTIAMDFWASLEHKIRYKKKELAGLESIVGELKDCAEQIASIDFQMQSIRDRIDKLYEESEE